MIDYSINLCEAFATLIMRDPSGLGASVNFWAYKRIFAEASWAALATLSLLMSFAMTIYRLHGKHKEKTSLIACLADW